MKKILIVVILITCPNLNSFSQSIDSLKKIDAILTQVEQKIKSIKIIQYQSNYKSINSGIDDSISTAEAQIWLRTDTSEKIFQSKFHIKGETNKNSSFEYYYDGLNSITIYHYSKSMTITNPYLFPNDEHNPAKTLAVFVYTFGSILIDTDIKGKLLKNNPKRSFRLNGDEYTLNFEYPLNEYKQKIIRTLFINKKSFLVTGDGYFSTLNGTRYQSEMRFSNIVLNEKNTLANIPMLNSYNGYTIDDSYNKLSKSTKLVNKKMIGTQAKDFKYQTFTNKTIQLSDLKGKYILLDFWETWCGYCIVAMPKIQEVYEKYGNKGLVVYGVSTENPDKIKKLMAANNLTYEGLIGDNKILYDYKIFSRPVYVLIDPTGKIIEYTEAGFEKITNQLESVLK